MSIRNFIMLLLLFSIIGCNKSANNRNESSKLQIDEITDVKREI